MAKKEYKSLIDASMVHTTEAEIFRREGIDLEPNRESRQAPKRISHWSSSNGYDSVTFRFNPNKEVLYGETLPAGDCTSLREFERILRDWVYSEGFERDDIRFRRADFAIDCMQEQNKDTFYKIAYLLISVYIVRKKLSERDFTQYITWIAEESKGISTTNSSSPIRFTLYNKLLEDPSRGAYWRLEIKYIRNSTNQSRLNDVFSILKAMTYEIQALPDFYEIALQEINKRLLSKYVSMKNGTKKKQTPYDFLFDNSRYIFSNKQVRGFFQLLTGETDAQKLLDKSKYYARYYSIQNISKAQFKAFCEEIVSAINSYIARNN